MEETIKIFAEKITSYNIFNNLLPGIIFCFTLNHTTRFNIGTDSILENIFIYYFVGMVISRIGSLVIEKLLKKIKIKNRKTKKKEAFLIISNYSDYVDASENQETIKILSETNNTYRTLTALFSSLVIVKIYEIVLHDLLLKTIGENVISILMFVLLAIMFVFSYRKQTAYISRRVEKYKKENQGEKL